MLFACSGNPGTLKYLREIFQRKWPDFCFKEMKQMPDIYLYRDKKISILKKNTLVTTKQVINKGEAKQNDLLCRR